MSTANEVQKSDTEQDGDQTQWGLSVQWTWAQVALSEATPPEARSSWDSLP